MDLNWSKERSPVVLMVEDDPGDQELIRRALENHHDNIDLRVMSDGEEALDYLKNVQAGTNSDECPQPILVLLDLNMPKFDGREILQYVRQQSNLKLTPIVVLTTSTNERDVQECYALGCNTFVSKPDTVQEFMDAIGQIGSYWLNIASIPSLCAV